MPPTTTSLQAALSSSELLVLQQHHHLVLAASTPLQLNGMYTAVVIAWISLNALPLSSLSQASSLRCQFFIIVRARTACIGNWQT